MKRIAILIGLAGWATLANAQLATGSNGLTIKAGTPFASQGLVLTPSTDLTLQNDTIRLSSTSLTVGSGNSINRVYTISPSLTIFGTVGIRYAGSELNGNQENTLSVLNASPNASFVTLTSNASTGGGYFVNTIAASNLVLNRITASSAVPLAIRYHNFTGAADASCSIRLNWNAAQAKSANFHIERSQDGKTFRILEAIVTQSGDLFSATDMAPLPGKNIYRIAISEIEKPVIYSNIITLNAPCNLTAETKIYPNPTGGYITVTLEKLVSDFATIDLIDISGKVIKTYRTNKQTSTLDLQGFASGSYFIKVTNGSSIENIKVVKL